MKKLEKKIKNRYSIFILTIAFILLAVVFIIIRGIGMQNADANTINLAGKQSLLGEQIVNQVLKIKVFKNNLSNDELKNLSILTNKFEITHNKLYEKNKVENNKRIDSLFQVMTSSHHAIVFASKIISNNPDSLVLESSIRTILETEKPFLANMNLIVDTYEAEARKELQILKYIIFGLAIATTVILIGEFFFVIAPVFKELLEKNKKLTKSNIELALSENSIKANMLELSKLKTDLEAKEAYNRIFIDRRQWRLLWLTLICAT